MDTDLVREELPKEGRRAYWTAHIPAAKIGSVEEVAQGVLFLCRSDLGFTVGTRLVMDGVHSLVLHGMGV